MHFFYADETGSTGTDLLNPEQPVFVFGGISVRDEGWNATRESLDATIRGYFAPNEVPEEFELHAFELLSPDGEGPFRNHDRERRNTLVDTLLDLLEDRHHDNILVAVDKATFSDCRDADLSRRPHLTVEDPFPVAFDQYISAVEKVVRDRLGHSARALAIVDEHGDYEAHVDRVIKYRRREIAKRYRLKWIVEFAYPVDSRRNPMVQLSDLVIYIARRFFEVDKGYRPEWTKEARDQYRAWYGRIHARRKNKTMVDYEDRYRQPINDLMNEIWCKPSRGGLAPE